MAPGFVYTLPLLEWVVEKWTGDLAKKERIANLTLNVIKVHTTMRGRTSDSLYHPKLLPRERLLNLLITIISKFIKPVGCLLRVFTLEEFRLLQNTN